MNPLRFFSGSLSKSKRSYQYSKQVANQQFVLPWTRCTRSRRDVELDVKAGFVVSSDGELRGQRRSGGDLVRGTPMRCLPREQDIQEDPSPPHPHKMCVR